MRDFIEHLSQKNGSVDDCVRHGSGFKWQRESDKDKDDLDRTELYKPVGLIIPHLPNQRASRRSEMLGVRTRI